AAPSSWTARLAARGYLALDRPADARRVLERALDCAADAPLALAYASLVRAADPDRARAVLDAAAARAVSRDDRAAVARALASLDEQTGHANRARAERALASRLESSP